MDERQRRLGRYGVLGVALAIAAVVLAGAFLTGGFSRTQGTTAPSHLSTDLASLTYDGEWANVGMNNTSAPDVHAFVYGISGLSASVNFGSQTVDLKGPGGATLTGLTFYLEISTVNLATDMQNPACIYQYTTSGTHGTLFAGSSCQVKNGGSILVYFPAATCLSTSYCGAITNGNGAAGSVVINAIGTIQLPNGPWSPTTPGIDMMVCMVVPAWSLPP